MCRFPDSLPVDMSPSSSGPFIPNTMAALSHASGSTEALEIEMAASWLQSQIASTDSPTEDEDDDDEEAFDPLAATPSPTPTPPPQPVPSDQPADAPASQQSVHSNNISF